MEIWVLPWRQHKVLLGVITWMISSPIFWNDVPVVRTVSCCWIIVLWICITPVDKHHTVPNLLRRYTCTFVPGKHLSVNIKVAISLTSSFWFTFKTLQKKPWSAILRNTRRWETAWQTGKQQYPDMVTAPEPIPVRIVFFYMLVSFLVVNISCKVGPNSIMLSLHTQNSLTQILRLGTSNS